MADAQAKACKAQASYPTWQLQPCHTSAHLLAQPNFQSSHMSHRPYPSKTAEPYAVLHSKRKIGEALSPTPVHALQPLLEHSIKRIKGTNETLYTTEIALSLADTPFRSTMGAYEALNSGSQPLMAVFCLLWGSRNRSPDLLRSMLL